MNFLVRYRETTPSLLQLQLRARAWFYIIYLRVRATFKFKLRDFCSWRAWENIDPCRGYKQTGKSCIIQIVKRINIVLIKNYTQN
jgi:hypothetical protein